MSSATTKAFSPWLWLTLLATLALTWFAAQEDDTVEIVQPKKSLLKTDNRSVDVTQSDQQNLRLLPRKSFESDTDIFAVERPRPTFTPVVTKAPVEKIAPVLAPLPFKYIGRWKDENGLQVLLEANGEVLTVNTGDVLLGRYQVQNIQENAFNIVVEFLTMPENQKQLLQVGKAKDE